ncbi:matrix protein [Trichosanthes associated rhabdovirus 1]|uniref:Matrix protein n=1 Tax=Trichosanthes associated rhabdovirus 1 TaxID=2654367 RepID=A0A6F9FD15_9RHAB|nr:matrix protein [Trichosanthes associated rhabdovirus 1]DAC81996.1 TPA_asm: matrix protein [Trichosanthes associated rhabdovirus 1]
MDCKFYVVSCVGVPVSFSLMAKKKAASFTTEERLTAFQAVLEKTGKINKTLQGILIHLIKIGRFAAVDDETQDMFLGPRTQRITYNMPEFTLIPCFEDLIEETVQLTLQGGLLSIDHVRLIARADVIIKVSSLSFPDATLIFKERPNDCVEAYIPEQQFVAPTGKASTSSAITKTK